MSVKTIGSCAIAFVSLAVLPALVAAQERETPTRAVPIQENPETRERPGGYPIGEAETLDRSQDAAEDGLPETHRTPQGRADTLPQGELRSRFLRPRWRLGVYAYNTPTGVVVTRVLPGTPAARVGFEPGDRIVAVSGYQVGMVSRRVYYLGEELQRRVDHRGRVELLVQNVRNNRLLNMDVQLDSPRFRGEPAAVPEREGTADGQRDRDRDRVREAGRERDRQEQ